MTYLNDHWTLDTHRLGYEHIVDELVELAEHVEPPFATAVYGGWGSGKTSLLRKVMCRLGGDLIGIPADKALIDDPYEVNKQLHEKWYGTKNRDNQNPIRCVWFNPWQHQFEDHPLVALLHEIRAQMSFYMKTRQKVGKLSFVALKTGLRLMDDLVATVTKAFSKHGVKLDVAKMEKEGLTYESRRFESMLDSQRFQLHFETAIAHLVGDDQKNDAGKLIIFIDDLDRCQPSRVLHLLECIKLYLSTKQCVFFVGLDPQHTEAALMEQVAESQVHARQYLQKLFQLTYPLPRSRRYAEFIQTHLEELNTLQSATNPVFKFETLETRHFWEGGEYSLSEILAEILEGNPRRIKNFLNLLFMRGKLYKKRHKNSQTADPLRLALLLGLRYYYPSLYALLEEAPEHLSDFKIGFATSTLVGGSNGMIAFVAKTAFSPLHEEFFPGEGVSLKEYAVYEDEVHRQVNPLFLVQKQFKQAFMDLFVLNEQELRAYLEP